MTKTIYAPGLSGKGTDARARDAIGDRFTPGWCLYWCLVNVYKVPGLGDWDGDGAADAEDFWKAAVRDGVVVHAKDIGKVDDIPAGVLLMWTGGSGDHGHAAYCLGGGRMVSTDAPTRGVIGEVDIEWPAKHWGHKFVGYVLVSAHRFTLTREAAPKPPAPEKLVYQVTAAAGVNVRSEPSTRASIVGTLAKGRKITADKVVVREGRHWVSRITGGKRVYMAREFFARV